MHGQDTYGDSKYKHLQKTLECRKIARLQYLPSEDSAMMDARLVAVEPLPEEVKIGKTIIPVPRVEDMDEQQRYIFKKFSRITWIIRQVNTAVECSGCYHGQGRYNKAG